MTPGPGIEPGPHWWEASALNTALTLHPSKQWQMILQKTRVMQKLLSNFRVLANLCFFVVMCAPQSPFFLKKLSCGLNFFKDWESLKSTNLFVFFTELKWCLNVLPPELPGFAFETLWSFHLATEVLFLLGLQRNMLVSPSYKVFIIHNPSLRRCEI